MPNVHRLLLICMTFAACTAVAGEQVPDPLQQQVRDTEHAFAQTMADRDFEAFATFLSPEAIFFSGENALRGKQQVTEAWRPYFEQPEAPFSWKPQTVEVLESGTLALSSGPVHDSSGKLAGTFTSIWRLGDDGNWKIIFDKGNQACEP